MKVSYVKCAEDLLNFLEGCLNDFETGVSSKSGTINNITELILKCVKSQKK
jgi:hypothetical protein